MADFAALRNALEVITIQEEATFNTRPSTDVTGEVLTVAAGVVSGTLASPVVMPGTFVATSNTGKVATANGFGVIEGDVDAGGTINNTTGVISFTFDDGAASTSATGVYTKIGVDADVLALSAKASYTDGKEVILDGLMDSNNMPNDSQDISGSSEGTLPLSVRLNNATDNTFGLIGNNGLLIKNLFGSVSYVAETTILATWGSASTGDLSAGGGTGRVVGDLICVKLSISTEQNKYETALITAISGDTITVSPAFSVIPQITDEVPAVQSYEFTDAGNDPATLWVNKFVGDKMYFPFGGQRVDSLEFAFPNGDFIGISASLTGAKANSEITDAVKQIQNPFTPITQAVDGKQPLAAVAGKACVKGLRLAGCDIMNSAMTLASENHKPSAIDGTHTICRNLRGPFTLEGSLEIFVQNEDHYNYFRDGDKSDLILHFGSAANNMLAVAVPQMHITASPVEDEGLESKYNVSFTGEIKYDGTTRWSAKLFRLALFGTE